MPKEKNKHLTESQRRLLELGFQQRKSFAQIERETGIPRTTIKREIMKHREESTKVFYGRRFNPCLHRYQCNTVGLCNDLACSRKCSICGKYCNEKSCCRFSEEHCLRLKKAPYVCNGCPDERRCSLRKFYYIGKVAHNQYRETLIESRQGVNVTEGELRALNEILVPALNKGQSPHHAMVATPEAFTICERTLYSYINKGVLYSKRHNLPMAVRYKKRKGKPVEHKIDRNCKKDRTWKDYLKFIAKNPEIDVVQMDVVEGGQNDKCVLLTIMFPKLDFMIARLLPSKCALYVTEAFNWLWKRLGPQIFCRLFPAILTDNGGEFSNPLAIEIAPDTGAQRTKIFYARPYTPTDKPEVERNHEYIRRIVDKGHSFDNLTQAQVDLMMSHINSYSRAALMDDSICPCRTPYERFVFEYGEDVAKKLGIVAIPLKDVTLKPELFDMN